MNINSLLKQTAVYWGSPVADGFGGYTFASPVEVACRWEDKQELFLNNEGKQELSSAIVYSNTDFDVNGYLFLGDLGDLDSDPDDPTEISGAKEIRKTGKSPSLNASQFLRKNWL